MNRHQLLDWLPSRTVRRTGRARTPRPRWRFAPTFTMLPGAGSPAIDAGSDALVPAGLTTDQRGFAPPHLQRQGRYRRRRGRGHRGPRHHQPPATTFVTGRAGTFVVTASGFTTTPAIMMSGALPAGVTFVDNGNGTATLSGTPAPGRDGVYVLTLTAINGVAPAAVQPFVLRVNQAPAFTSPRPRPSPSAPPATSA